MDLWAAIKKVDSAGVAAALAANADANALGSDGLTPLHYIARAGHYKYPPRDIPAQLIKAGANLEAADSGGHTALQVALLSGWQNIATLLLESGASPAGVAAIKGQVTCGDCRRVIAENKL